MHARRLDAYAVHAHEDDLADEEEEAIEDLRGEQDGPRVGGEHPVPHRVEAEEQQQDDPSERV